MNKDKNNEKLDNTWIIDFEKKDKLYHDFYADDVYFINLHFIYIQKNMEIEKIREETFFMKTPNIILREEIIGLLKKNALDNNNKYSIFSLLKFNFCLKPEDIHFFLRDPSNYKGASGELLTSIKHIDTIVFEKTINMFQDLNTLYFIFVEKNMDLNDKNKKNLTKKIYLHLIKHKKTKRKFY
jgi:hypothetical protein